MAEGEGEVVGSVQVGWDVKRWVGVAVEDGKEEDGVVWVVGGGWLACVSE